MTAAGAVRQCANPWTAARESAVTGLRERFGVPVWWGEHTHTFWAMVTVQDRPRLVEAITPEELAQAILSARAWPWPPAERAMRALPPRWS